MTTINAPQIGKTMVRFLTWHLFVLGCSSVILTFYLLHVFPPVSETEVFTVPSSVTSIEIEVETSSILFRSLPENETDLRVEFQRSGAARSYVDAVANNYTLSCDNATLYLGQTGGTTTSQAFGLAAAAVVVYLPLAAGDTNLSVAATLGAGEFEASLDIASQFYLGALSVASTKGSVTLKNVGVAALDVCASQGSVWLDKSIVSGYARLENADGDIVLSFIALDSAVLRSEAASGTTSVFVAVDLYCGYFDLSSDSQEPYIEAHNSFPRWEVSDSSEKLRRVGYVISPLCENNVIAAHSSSETNLYLIQQITQ
eukprot:gnl/Chilomastix_cuspidata/2312.p2 GENE.gnl/Chilomastix_cuspidata/2312~~gnl/Chilomastix_cuspidata/2312.p2  ORF type:complete len:314 (+),score=152.02 gnl/Chilomastix_cuspidata/2312:19-960(+)